MQEIEARAILSQQQIQVVKGQIGAKQRDVRLLQLTSRELDTLPKSTKVYEGVGKMCVSFAFHTNQRQTTRVYANGSIREACRFVLEELPVVQKRLEDEKKSIEGDIENHGKKLRYFETTFEKAQDNLNQILNRGR